MKFKTQHNTKPSPPEIGGGEKLVETAGYIPAYKQIENLLMAGKRLVSYREQYDFTGEIDEDFNDPTRNGNFDLADATQINLQMEAKARAAAVPGDIPSPPAVDDKTEPEQA